MYDQYGFYSENMPPGGYPGGADAGGQDVNFNFDGFDFGQAQGGGGSSFRDLFSNFFGGRGGSAVQEEAEEGADLEYRIENDFWEAVRGGVKKIQITPLDSCPTCRGTGPIRSP